MAEGRLCEMEKGGFSVETEDGQKLGFKISPETIIYTGENSEMLEGQAVKVVFDRPSNRSPAPRHNLSQNKAAYCMPQIK